MRRLIIVSLLGCLSIANLFAKESEGEGYRQQIERLEKPLYNPFVERYMLDELKGLRQDLQTQRAEFVERFANTQLQASDRAILYTTSTVNNIFYIIAAAASILALVGWSTVREIRQRLNEMVETKVSHISNDYEKRLQAMESTLKDRTERIINAQEEITLTNTLHSLWMRAGLEATPQSRIDVYDQILELHPDDVEALTYKADAVLELDEVEWALNLCDKALSLNPDYAYAHYQYACACSTLNQLDKATEELEYALRLSSTYVQEALKDESLENLRASGRVEHLLHANDAPVTTNS